MTDILDTLEELDDDLFDEDDFDVELIEGEVIGDDIIPFDPEMNEVEAREITEAIRSTATATYVLLTIAHERSAHKALGYATWADYVNTEFDVSAQRSYQLLDHGKAIAAIEAAAPEGTVIKLTEAQARDIKRELPNITERVSEETRDQSPEDAQETVDRIIDEVREQKKLEDKEAEKKAKAAEAADAAAEQDALEAAADAILEADRPEGMTDIADDGLVEMELEGGGESNLSGNDSMALYNFFNMLSSIESLPEPEDFVNIIPSGRRDEVNEQLMQATAWLNRFQTIWELEEN